MRRDVKVLVAFLLTIAMGICAPAASSRPNEGTLLFDEDFQSLSHWDHQVTAWVGKNEFQYFSASAQNSYIKDSILHIKPTLTVRFISPCCHEHLEMSI